MVLFSPPPPTHTQFPPDYTHTTQHTNFAPPPLQGHDPLALLLSARERQFVSALSAAAAEHQRAVQRLKAAMAATATDDKMQVGGGGTRII